MLSTKFPRFFVSLSIVATLSACASNQSTANSDEGQEVTYTATAEETAQIASDKPLPPGPIVMYMNGLSCPLCATNIDKQIEPLPGVSNVKVDLSTGKVRADLVGPKTPSPQQLAKAADSAGVTLVKITR
ncbi:MAG: heavy-metal-associated domain-containing protein [Phycisphaerales bacterium]